MKRIAILGCGAIGTQIALAIDSGKIPATLTHVYDKSRKAAQTLVDKLNLKPEIVDNAHLLSSNNTHIVVEAASQDAVRDVALSIIQNKKDMMIMSVGALLDESVFEVLVDACKEFGKTIYLPSGAVAGIDALKAVRGELDSVTLTTTKHPRSLKGARFFENSDIKLDSLAAPTTIFEGNATKAVSEFPANINVAALLSIAGVGGSKTHVRIVADPACETNTHHVCAKGKFGSITIELKNIPDPANPKTSRLATLAAIEVLSGICSGGIRIGT